MANDPWQLPAPQPFNPFDYALNFLETPFYNTVKTAADLPVVGDFFGNIRDAELFSRQEDFQIQNPLAATVADMAGWLIPGGAYFKATSKIPAFASIARAGAAAGRPGLGVAGAEIARWAPFNLAVTGGRAAAGQYEDWTQPAEELALGTFLSGALGAVGPHIPNRGIGSFFHIPAKEWYGVEVGGASRLGQRSQNRIGDLIPGFSDIKPFQFQARDILEAAQTGTVPADVAQTELGLLQQRIAQERLAGGNRYATFAGDRNSPQDRELERLYKLEAAPDGVQYKNYQIPLVVQPGKTPERIADLTDLGPRLGFKPTGDGDNWLYHVRFPRIHIADASAKKLPDGTVQVAGAKRETTTWNKAFSVIEPGKIWMAREPDDGLWHIIRKLDPIEIKGTGWRNRYAVFKTDTPERFLADYADPGRLWRGENDIPLRAGVNAWNGRVGTKEGGAIFNSTRDLNEAIPLDDWRLAMAAKDKGSFAGVVKKAFDQSEVAGRTKDFLDRYVRPGVHQFKHPLAARSYMLMSAIKDNTSKAVRDKIESYEQVIQKLWREGKGEQIVEHGIRKLTPLDQIPDPEVRGLISVLREEGKLQIAEINKTKTAVGSTQRLIPTLENHLGISRVYDGSHFIPIRDTNGNAVAIAAGYGENAAKTAASKLVGRYAERGQPGLTWDPKEMVLRDDPNLPKEFRIVRGNPGFAEPRGNLGGYKWDVETPTADDFISDLNKNYSARANFQMKMSLEYFLRNDIEKLKELDPKAYDALESRLKALLGEPGAFENWQNKVVDKVLAPYIGQGSATKLAQKITEVNHHLQLGMGNVAYAVINALSIPTQLPAELSFLTTASLPKLGNSYTFIPTAGQDGLISGYAAIPRVFKLMQDGYRFLREENRPPKVEAVFARAKADGLYDPQYIEEWSGRMKTAITDLHAAGASGEGFAKWLGAASNYMGAQTEKLLRSYAIGSASAAILARFPQISEEQLYQYVKRFVGRTAFEYNRYSRPEIFTSPVGQVFGGFKTWQMNYLHMLGDYSAEATRGNLAPLLWTVGAIGSLGGLGALPVLPAVADQISELLNDQPLQVYLAENFSPTASDALYYGLPSVLTGLSATGNIALPGSHLAHDAEMLFGVASLERAKNIGRSLGSVFDAAVVAGVDPLAQPKIQAQLMQGWSPRSLYRVFQTFQDGAEGSLIAPSTGYKTVEGLGPYQQAMYMLGFNPVEVEKQYTVYDTLMKNKELRTLRTSQLGEAWAQAQVSGDRQTLELLARRAAAEGVDISSVLRSANRRIQDMNKDMFGRNFREEELAAYDSVLGD